MQQLPHLQRYSNWNLEWRERYADDTRAWTCSSKPSPFSLLPILKLQPRQIHYTCSQLESFTSWCKNASVGDYSGVFTVVSKRTCKRKRDEYELTPHQMKKKYGTLKMQKIFDDWKLFTKRKCYQGYTQMVMKMFEHWILFIKQELLLKKYQMQVRMMTQMFDMKHIKGKGAVDGENSLVWRLVSFRTDGVQLSLTFGTVLSQAAPNTESLVKAGYQIPESKVDVATASRGVYSVSEDRNDLENTNNGNLVLVPLDPGLVKPLQAAEIPLGECDTAASICNYLTEHDALWHYTSKEWKERSGRVKSEKKETLIRERNRAYESVIEKLRKERKSTASMGAMESYCKAVFANMNVLRSELITVNINRSKMKWARMRKTVSWLSRVADKVFDRERGHVSRAKTSPTTSIRVAFLGDGTFGHRRVMHQFRKRGWQKC